MFFGARPVGPGPNDFFDWCRVVISSEPDDPHKADTLDVNEIDRLADLQALEDQLYTDMSSYAHNESCLVPESEFQDYAQELANDIGMVDTDSAIYPYVDWERWADALKQDYTSVDFDGNTYLIRSC
jgi:hypothetical protein